MNMQERHSAEGRLALSAKDLVGETRTLNQFAFSKEGGYHAN